jgi:hypothetical protein
MHPTDTRAPSPQPPRLLDLVRQTALEQFGQDGPAERIEAVVRTEESSAQR